MKPLSSSMIPHDHMFRRLLASCMVAWLIVGLLPGAARGYIGRPSIEELVDRADLIVTGRVNSLRMTSFGLCRRISLAIVGTLTPLLMLMAWRWPGPRRQNPCIHHQANTALPPHAHRRRTRPALSTTDNVTSSATGGRSGGRGETEAPSHDSL